MSNLAEQTLTAISKTFFGGKNYNDKHYFDNNMTAPDDGLAGIVYETIRRGESKEIGNFHIAANGSIKDFPSLPQDFIEGINKSCLKELKVTSNPKSEGVTDSIDIFAKKAPGIAKPKKRGRPKRKA